MTVPAFEQRKPPEKRVPHAELQPPDRRRPYRQIAFAAVAALLVVIVATAIQQMTFYRFVQERGGRPDGLFKSEHGDYYKLWSLTVPLWSVSAILAVFAIGESLRLRACGFRWYVIAFWFAYLIVLWLFVAASSGVVEILGKGEAFI